MDPLRGIAVEITSNYQVLNLYDDPDAAEAPESRSRNHYVEAVTGSTFQVKVNLNADFDFSKMNNKHSVYVSLNINGQSRTFFREWDKRKLKEMISLSNSAEFLFTGPIQFCKDTGQWMCVDYCFGNLILKETSDHQISLTQAQDIGNIKITIRRVSMVKRRVPHYKSKEPLETTSEVPEKVLKGRSVDTNVGFANARVTSQPQPLTTRPVPINGEAGEPMVFNIFYRSRRALQMLGCIPRSPSPEAPVANDQSTLPGDVMQEVRDLRARLALLERGLNVKSEPASATITGLKRERDEDINEGPRHQRRRQSSAIKIESIVDLTDD